MKVIPSYAPSTTTKSAKIFLLFDVFASTLVAAFYTLAVLCWATQGTGGSIAMMMVVSLVSYASAACGIYVYGIYAYRKLRARCATNIPST